MIVASIFDHLTTALESSWLRWTSKIHKTSISGKYTHTHAHAHTHAHTHRPTHTHTHTEQAQIKARAHCKNLSCVFHNRLLAWHHLPTVSVSLSTVVWCCHMDTKSPDHVWNHLLFKLPGRCWSASFVFLSTEANLECLPLADFQTHLSFYPATSSPSAVPQCPLILPGCRGDGNWGDASVAGSGGWVAIPSPHQSLLTESFYGPWYQEVCVCVCVWVAWRIAGGSRPCSLILVANTT